MKTLLISFSLLAFQLNACSNDKSAEGSQAAVTSNDATAVSSESPNASGETPVQPSTPEPSVVETPVIETPSPEAEVLSFEIDATSKTAWAYLDFDTGKIVEETDLSWDLAFKRTSIKMNTDVLAQVFKEQKFEDLNEIPEGVYAPDAPVSGGLETDGLFFHTPSAWYQYNMETHVISSRNYTYVIKTNKAQYVKLQLTDYYNVDRLPAFIQGKTQLLVKPQGE